MGHVGTTLETVFRLTAPCISTGESVNTSVAVYEGAVVSDVSTVTEHAFTTRTSSVVTNQGFVTASTPDTVVIIVLPTTAGICLAAVDV